MSRGELDERTLESIERELPDLSLLRDKVLALEPSVISMKYPADIGVPVASVCLADAIHALAGVRYALHECHAHGIYYRERIQPPNEMAAVFFERYYADDAALRLYSAGEHVANAIIFMLEITGAQLKPHRKRRLGQQSIVGEYLGREKPALRISQLLAVLAASKEWKATIAYRNKWVHDQPPTVQGLGIVHHRRKRWQVSEDGRSRVLGVGGGDKPTYTTGDILGFIKPGFRQFLAVVDGCVQYYFEILAEGGISISGDKIGLRVKIP